MATSGVMEWEKFKKAEDLGFARRQRNFQPLPDGRYLVKEETLHIREVDNAQALVASVISKDESRTPLRLVVAALEPGIFRVTFEDLEQLKHRRHVVTGVLMDHAVPFSPDQTSLSHSDGHAYFSVNGWDTKVKIEFDPFRLDLVASVEEKCLLSLNSASRLNVEAFETKDEVGVFADEQGRWEETFKGFDDPKARGPESVGVDVAFPCANQVHGIPERTMNVALDDTVASEGTVLSEPYRLYNLDVSYFELMKPLGLYGAVPLLIGRDGESSAAVFWLNSSETFVDVSTDDINKGKASHWYSETGRLEMYMLPGPTIGEVFRQYLWLTGAPAMPQYFALGYHQCRYSYMSDEDARGVNAGFEKHKIPYDVLWLDIDHTDGKRYFTWNKETFPDPQGLQEHIASFGRKVVTIIDPHIKRDPTFPLHQSATEKGLYITDPALDGKAFRGECWAGESSYFDYTNPKAREFWASRFNVTDYPHFTPHLHVWNDMNEPSVFDGPENTIPKHMQHMDNVEHRHVHNIYGHDMVRATHAGLLAARDGTDRPFVLTRSFFAGSQRYCAVWTGDNTADWSHLSSSVPMLLSLQLCGIAHSGADVGGFFFDPDGELVARWYQVGAFQPFFRGHSMTNTKRREPWGFGEPFTSVITAAIRERYQLLPLWYTLFAGIAAGEKAGFDAQSVAPPMRPLWWEFPGEAGDDGRWMVGNCLLVAPVAVQGAEEHTVNLPPGTLWYDIYDPDRPGVQLLQTEQVALKSPLERMFVMQRGGTVVPRLRTARQSSFGMLGDTYSLVVALDADGCADGRLYVDDGSSYKFEGGEFVHMRYSYAEGTLTATKVAGEGVAESLSTVVNRVDVLGFGKTPPQKVSINGREVECEVDEVTGVLRVDGLCAGAGGTGWTMVITR